MIRPGALVIVHLINPTEKFWGILQELGVAGVMLRGLNVSSFDDWMAQATRRGDQTLGLSTMFVPLFRVERIFLDEAVGEVESYRQRFQRRVGIDVERYLGVSDEEARGEEESSEVPLSNLTAPAYSRAQSLRPYNAKGRGCVPAPTTTTAKIVLPPAADRYHFRVVVVLQRLAGVVEAHDVEDVVAQAPAGRVVQVARPRQRRR